MFYWWRQKRKLKRDPIGFIRQEFAFWGHPVDHMTDEELKLAVVQMSKTIASSGFSAEQVMRGMQLMNTPFN